MWELPDSPPRNVIWWRRSDSTPSLEKPKSPFQSVTALLRLIKLSAISRPFQIVDLHSEFEHEDVYTHHTQTDQTSQDLPFKHNVSLRLPDWSCRHTWKKTMQFQRIKTKTKKGNASLGKRHRSPATFCPSGKIRYIIRHRLRSQCTLSALPPCLHPTYQRTEVHCIYTLQEPRPPSCQV